MFIEILLTIIKTWKQAKCPSIDEWIKKIWCMCVCIYTCAVLCWVTQSFPTLWDPMDCSPPGSSVHGDSPGKNTGVCCHILLQGIFPTQVSNPGFPHCRQILYQFSHKGSPRILEWAAYSFSRGSSPPRNWTGVACIAGGFFTSWATREVCMHTHTYTGILLSHKTNEIIASAATWPNKINQTEKDKYHMIITNVWNYKDDTNELIFKNRNRITERKKKNLWLPKGEGGEE